MSRQQQIKEWLCVKTNGRKYTHAYTADMQMEKKIRPVAKLQLGGFRMEQHFPQCNNNANVTTVASPMMSIPMV